MLIWNCYTRAASAKILTKVRSGGICFTSVACLITMLSSAILMSKNGGKSHLFGKQGETRSLGQTQKSSMTLFLISIEM